MSQGIKPATAPIWSNCNNFGLYWDIDRNAELLSYSTGAILALHWGTLHRTIRTKDAAIAGFWAEQRLTANAFVEELAGVS
jgi:hypothetical protein